MADPLVRVALPFDAEANYLGGPLWILLGYRFGPAAIGWDTAVLRRTIAETWGTAPSSIAMNRVLGTRTLYAPRGEYWTDWHVFEKVTAALAGRPVEFDHIQPLAPEEILIGILSAEDVRPGGTWGEEVQRYIAACCRNDHLWYLEEPLLGVAGDALDEALRDAGFDGLAPDRAKVAERLKAPAGGDDDADLVDPIALQVMRTRQLRATARSYLQLRNAQVRAVSAWIKENPTARDQASPGVQAEKMRG